MATTAASGRLRAVAAWLDRVWRENWLTLVVIAGLASAFFLLRSTPTDLASVEAFDAQITAGQPTVIYFYSNT